MDLRLELDFDVQVQIQSQPQLLLLSLVFPARLATNGTAQSLACSISNLTHGLPTDVLCKLPNLVGGLSNISQAGELLTGLVLIVSTPDLWGCIPFTLTRDGPPRTVVSFGRIRFPLRFWLWRTYLFSWR